MKKVLVALLSISLVVASCEKEEEKVAETGTVSLRISNTAGDAPIELGQLLYTNSAGELYSVDVLKYYLSHITLIGSDGHEHELFAHELIDAAVPASAVLSKGGVMNGTYTAIRFGLGVDYEHNHSGDQAGDLDPINGMIWTWNTGYIFFKHEGQFQQDETSFPGIIYHYGTDQAYVDIELPINLKVEGDSKTIRMDFDLNSLYSSPNTIQFTGNANHQSTSANDIPWIAAVRQNFPGAFTITSVN